MLNEAVTKAAQFCNIVKVLLDFGAGLEVTDGQGNTPLHNAALYHPSTQVWDITNSTLGKANLQLLYSQIKPEKKLENN